MEKEQTPEARKGKVKKTTIDKAVRALIELDVAKREAYKAGKPLSKKIKNKMWDIMYAYCMQLSDEGQDSLNNHHYYDIINLCVDMAENPFETAYKMFALLGVEVV